MDTAEERGQPFSEDGRVEPQWGTVACCIWLFVPAVYLAGTETWSEMPVGKWEEADRYRDLSRGYDSVTAAHGKR